jgi:hypothetical protein
MKVLSPRSRLSACRCKSLKWFDMQQNQTLLSRHNNPQLCQLSASGTIEKLVAAGFMAKLWTSLSPQRCAVPARGVLGIHESWLTGRMSVSPSTPSRACYSRFVVEAMENPSRLDKVV